MTDAASIYTDEMLALLKELDADALQWITDPDHGVNVDILDSYGRSIWRAASQEFWYNRYVQHVGSVGQDIINIALDNNTLP